MFKVFIPGFSEEVAMAEAEQEDPAEAGVEEFAEIDAGGFIDQGGLDLGRHLPTLFPLKRQHCDVFRQGCLVVLGGLKHVQLYLCRAPRKKDGQRQKEKQPAPKRKAPSHIVPAQQIHLSTPSVWLKCPRLLSRTGRLVCMVTTSRDLPIRPLSLRRRTIRNVVWQVKNILFISLCPR